MGRLEWIAECVGMLKLRFRLFEVMYVEVDWTSPNLLGESQNMFSAKQRTSFPDRFVFCTLESAPEAIECRRFLSGGRRNGQNIGAVHRYRLQPDINYHYRGRFFNFWECHTQIPGFDLCPERAHASFEVKFCAVDMQIRSRWLNWICFPCRRLWLLERKRFQQLVGLLTQHMFYFFCCRFFPRVDFWSHPGWVRQRTDCCSFENDIQDDHSKIGLIIRLWRVIKC